MSKSANHTNRLKMSNLILVGIVLTSAIILCSFIVSVNTKAKEGEYTYVNRDKAMYSRHRFEGKTVVVQNIDDCTVIMSDSLSVETHKDDRDKFEYDVRPDSVHVSQTRASHNRVFLYLPSGSRLVVNASNVTIKGSLFDHEQRASYDVVLRDSKLLVSAAKLHTFFDRLKISGSGQNELIIDDFVHITDLDIENITGVNIAEGWQVGNLKTAFLSGSAMSKSGDSLSIRSR